MGFLRVRSLAGVDAGRRRDVLRAVQLGGLAAGGRDGFVTLVANYQPGQAPGNGPNYYTLDPAAVYEIMIDNDGNAVEDVTFQFRPTVTYKNITVNAGGAADAATNNYQGIDANNLGNTYSVGILGESNGGNVSVNNKSSITVVNNNGGAAGTGLSTGIFAQTRAWPVRSTSKRAWPAR